MTVAYAKTRSLTIQHTIVMQGDRCGLSVRPGRPQPTPSVDPAVHHPAPERLVTERGPHAARSPPKAPAVAQTALSELRLPWNESDSSVLHFGEVRAPGHITYVPEHDGRESVRLPAFFAARNTRQAHVTHTDASGTGRFGVTPGTPIGSDYRPWRTWFDSCRLVKGQPL